MRRNKSYREHLADVINGIVTHLHQALLDAIAFGNLQPSADDMVRIIHHHDEFWPLHFFERLVTCDDPFHY